MNEVVTITPFYYFMMEFAKLVYATFPIILIIIGLSFVVQSVRTEPWGNTIFGEGIIIGFVFIFIGMLLMVIL